MPFWPDRFHFPDVRSGSPTPPPPAFVGPLDGYADGLAGAWSVARRLLASYGGPLIRVRRSSDDEEMDIGALAEGTLDVTALDAWRGGSDWWLRRVYDQSGNVRHLEQATAASQPQGGIDGNELTYVTNPNVSPNAVTLATASLSLPITDSTQWGVGSAASFFFEHLSITEGTGNRRLVNVANALFFDPPGSTDAAIGSTDTGLYSMIGQLGGSGCRLTNGLATGTGTATAASTTASLFSAGHTGTGAQWTQHSRWYAGAVWDADIGDAAVDALQAEVRPLFGAL